MPPHDVLIQLIIERLRLCKDSALLDLVYKLLL